MTAQKKRQNTGGGGGTSNQWLCTLYRHAHEAQLNFDDITGNLVCTRYPGLVHMVDILPTLVGLWAGQGAEQQYLALATAGENSIPGLDGLDQWESITRHLWFKR